MTLIGAVLIMSVNGSLYAWGNLVTYVSGYLRDIGNDVDQYELYSVFPIILLTTTISMPIGMKISIKHPAYV